MATPIRGTTQARKLDYVPEQKEARKIASDLKVQLTGANGAAKSGTLKLMHTSHERKEMKFERKGLLQFFARRESKTRPTMEYLVKVLETAYQRKDLAAGRSGHVNQAGLEHKLRELKDFAQNHSSISSQQALQFINDLDVIEALEHITPFELGGPGTIPSTQGAANTLFPSINLQQALGRGNFGAVYDIPGSNKVFKELFGRDGIKTLVTGPTVDLKGMGQKWEPGAALLKGDSPVVMTESFIIKNETTGQFYNVPAGDLKSFLRNHPPADHPNAQVLKLVGEVMPKVNGQSLERKKDENGQIPPSLSHADQAQVQKEGLEGLLWMAQQRFIHGDIKPDNLKYDANAPGAHKLQFLDNGALQKVHDLDKANDFAPGGRTFQAHRVDGALGWAHPKISADKPWGPEADLWSFNLTTLHNRYPHAGEVIKRFLAPALSNPENQKTPSQAMSLLLDDLIKDGRDESVKNELKALKKEWTAPEGQEGQFVTLIKQGLDLAYASKTDDRAGYDAYMKGLEDLLRSPYLPPAQ